MATIPASENVFPILRLSEVAAPATPPAGEVHLYALADGTLAWKDDAGTVYPIAYGAGVSDLDDLGDVDTTGVGDGDVLTYDTAGPGWVAAAAAGGGGLTDYGQGFHVGDLLPGTPGTYDEEFEGTADTLPANWAWVGTPPTFYLNSRLPSWFYIDRAPNDGASYIARRSSFAPGTATPWGVWARLINGGRGGAYNSDMELWVLDSTGAEGRCVRIVDSVTIGARALVGSADTNWSGGPGLGATPSTYVGITRDASDYWRAWASPDGIGWSCVAGVGNNGTTHAFTPDRLEVRMKSQYGDTAPMRQGVDFVRYRTDTDFPRP